MLKKFRLYIAVISVLALAAVGMGATASTASAASCNPATSAIYWNGQFAYGAYLQNCSFVNAVQFGSGGDPHPGFIWDATVGLAHYASTGGGYVYGTFSTYAITYGVSNWGLTCPSIVHTVSSYFDYRIRNSNGNTWGSWHRYGGIRYEQIC